MNLLPIVDPSVVPVYESLPLQASARCRGTFAMVSLGCPKNLVDSERMLGLLRDDGWQLVREPQGADLVVINTALLSMLRDKSPTVWCKKCSH